MPKHVETKSKTHYARYYSVIQAKFNHKACQFLIGKLFGLGGLYLITNKVSGSKPNLNLKLGHSRFGLN